MLWISSSVLTQIRFLFFWQPHIWHCIHIFLLPATHMNDCVMLHALLNNWETKFNKSSPCQVITRAMQLWKLWKKIQPLYILAKIPANYPNPNPFGNGEQYSLCNIYILWHILSLSDSLLTAIQYIKCINEWGCDKVKVRKLPGSEEKQWDPPK